MRGWARLDRASLERGVSLLVHSVPEPLGSCQEGKKMKKGLQFFRDHVFAIACTLAVLVGIAAFVTLSATGRIDLNSLSQPIVSASSYEGQNPGVFGNGWGPTGLLAASPVEGCPTVDNVGLHTQDVPEAKDFAYATNAYGAFCAAILYTHGKDVEISSSKPTAWAVLYDVQSQGQHMSNGLVFSYGTSLIADNELGASTDGASYHAVPVALYVFSLPQADPVSLDTAEAALPQYFTGQNGAYYPMIQIAGDYGLPPHVSIIAALMQNIPMK